MIRSVEIKNFRGIQDGKLENLTPLTILVGPNGCGKSTILDALLIGANPNPLQAIEEAVKRRAGIRSGAQWLIYRPIDGNYAAITVQTENAKMRQCFLRLDPASIGSDEFTKIVCQIDTGRYDFEQKSMRSYGAGADVTIEFRPDNNIVREGHFFSVLEDVATIGLVEFQTGDFQIPLHTLVTQTRLQGRRDEVKALLANVVPGLVDITILTEGNSPLVFLEYKNGAIPVALSGDGIHALLRLCLELASRSKGVVLLEEPEVHGHPGAIRQSARAILAAIRRDIQVVLSTHSLELIDALLTETRDEAELEKLSLYSFVLREGCLKHYRLEGSEVGFKRTVVEDDLR